MHNSEVKVEIVPATQPQVELVAPVAKENMSMKIDDGFVATRWVAVMNARIRALNSDID